jgi:hypothetical protein
MILGLLSPFFRRDRRKVHHSSVVEDDQGKPCESAGRKATGAARFQPNACQLPFSSRSVFRTPSRESGIGGIGCGEKSGFFCFVTQIWP